MLAKRKSVFSNEVSLGLSTTLQNRPVQNRLSGISVDVLLNIFFFFFFVFLLTILLFIFVLLFVPS